MAFEGQGPALASAKVKAGEGPPKQTLANRTLYFDFLTADLYCGTPFGPQIVGGPRVVADVALSKVVTDQIGADLTSLIEYPGGVPRLKSIVRVNGASLLPATVPTAALALDSITVAGKAFLGSPVAATPGTYIEAISFTVTTAQAAKLLLLATGRQAYSGAAYPWDFRVEVNGVLVCEAGGDAHYAEPISTSGYIGVGPGTHTVRLLWLGGHASLQLTKAEVNVMGAMR